MTVPGVYSPEQGGTPTAEGESALVEIIARAIYCWANDMSAAANEAHLGCYFAPFNQFADDETRVMMNDHRDDARELLTAITSAGYRFERKSKP